MLVDLDSHPISCTTFVQFLQRAQARNQGNMFREVTLNTADYELLKTDTETLLCYRGEERHSGPLKILGTLIFDSLEVPRGKAELI
jgi:hypothetical protein